MSKLKIAFIGAGSYGFTFKLMMDILSFDELKECELAFMDVKEDRLENLKVLVDAFIEQHKLACTTTFTLNRKEALTGANFVINLVKIGFLEMSELDMDIPKKYGLKQTIGDTCGVAGVFRALRTMPFCIQMCKEMEEVSAPGAVVLNYTNPQAMLVMATAMSSSIPFIGLCHSVQGTTKAIAKYLDVSYDEMVYDAAGINHLAWVTTLERNGEDLYPALRQKVAERGIHGTNPADDDDVQPFLGPSRLDMLMRTGYAVTESSTHFPEYVAHYLRDDEMIERYKIPIDQYQKNIANKEKRYCKMVEEAREGTLPEWKRSVEYGSQIIYSMVTGKVARVYANVMNNGLITNLPEFSSVEVACLVDRNGVRPCHYGKLPTQLAASCRSNISVHQLAVEAILNGDRKSVYWALMNDPLTHTKLTIDQIEDVVDELISLQQEYLGDVFGA